MNKVGAIIVLYNPPQDRLTKALNILLPQVDCALLVDNSEGDNGKLYAHFGSKVQYMPMMRNVGIAKAQNVGIRRLRQIGAEYILFSDQDTVCEPHLVEYLQRGHQTLSRHFDVAAVGPLPVNRRTGAQYQLEGNVYEHGTVDDVDYAMKGYIMSSFSLIKASAFERVGLYNESLYIDAVETSWCFRAAYYFGMRSFVLPAVSVDHELGRHAKFLRRDISLSTPIRFYYQIRNLLWESSEEYATHFWRKRYRRTLWLKIIYYPLFCKGRWKYVKSIWRGLRDGLMRKHKMYIPQYDGSAPCLTGEWTFNDWVSWYQLQPLTSQMKILRTKISTCNAADQAFTRLLCFNGQIKGIVRESNLIETSDFDTVCQALHTDRAALRSLQDLIHATCRDIIFVCIETESADGALSASGFCFYPWNGECPHDNALGKHFLAAYTAKP